MDILLFGGAFDPVHCGHINILKSAMEYKNFDKIIVMPTGTPGHKNSCKAPFALRKKFAELSFCPLSDKIEVSDFEGESKEKSYSYLTVDYLKSKYPDGNIYFLIGSDSAILFSKWKNWQYLLKNVNLLIFSRDLNDAKQVAAAVEFLTSQGGQCFEVKAHITPVSSTFLRGEIGKNCDVGEFLNTEVWQYIQKYHIYSADYYEKNIGTARALVPLLLKEKRASHTFNVEKLAVELAHRYSLCEKKARLCALLHDIMKEADEDILLHRAYQSDIINKIPEKPLPLLHGFSAADYAAKEMGITDEETLWALRSHTCARVGMCDMEKVIYLADMLCEERDFAQKDYLLSCTFKNLDFAMKEALKASISWVSSKGGRVDRDSVDALRYFEGL